MNPTPPDRSVEEIVAEYKQRFGGVLLSPPEMPLADSEGKEIKWLREKLTSLHTQGIEAGRREAIKDMEKIMPKARVYMLPSIMNTSQFEWSKTYADAGHSACVEQMEKALATLRHPNEPV